MYSCRLLHMKLLLKLNRDRFSHAVCKLTVCETMHEAASEAMSCRLSSR